MKRDLKLVSEKTFSKKKHADHDISVPHFGDLRLVAEMASANALVLMYFKMDEQQEKKVLNTPFGVLEIPFSDKPVCGEVVALNKLEKFLGRSLEKKALRTLAKMKNKIKDLGEGAASTKAVVLKIIGEGAV